MYWRQQFFNVLLTVIIQTTLTQTTVYSLVTSVIEFAVVSHKNKAAIDRECVDSDMSYSAGILFFTHTKAICYIDMIQCFMGSYVLREWASKYVTKVIMDCIHWPRATRAIYWSIKNMIIVFVIGQQFLLFSKLNFNRFIMNHEPKRLTKYMNKLSILVSKQSYSGLVKHQQINQSVFRCPIKKSWNSSITIKMLH